MSDQREEPFGEDESYRELLLHMFEEKEEEDDEPKGASEEKEEEKEEDDNYREFLLHMFEEREGEEDEVKATFGEHEEEESSVNEIVEESTSLKSSVVDSSHHSQPNQENRDEIETHHNNGQEMIEDFDRLPRSRWNKKAFCYTIAASLISISLAYDQSIMGGAATYIKMDLKISDKHLEILTGILNIFTFLGLVTARLSSDRVGRRWTLMIGALLFFIGPLIMGLARNYAVFLIGRSFTNFSAGFALMIAPVYVSEISPTFSRGFFVSLPEAFISIGTILGNVSNYGFSYFDIKSGWRIMIALGAIPSVFVAVVFFLMPESPQWLVMQGRLRDAMDVLVRTSNSREEALLRLAKLKRDAGIPEDGNEDIMTTNLNTGVWRDIFHPTRSICHILACAIVIQLVRQACGIDNLLLFSPRIFERIRFNTFFKRLVANIVIDSTKIGFILIAGFLVDRIGRRPLLLISMGGMVFSLASLGVPLIMIDHSKKKLSWAIDMCIVSAIASVIFYSIGLGPITEVYCTEIFPLRLRAQGYAIGVGVKQAVFIVLSLAHLSIYNEMTLGGALLFFAAIAVTAWPVCYFIVRETNRRTPEDIEQLFGSFPEIERLFRIFNRWRHVGNARDGQHS